MNLLNVSNLTVTYDKTKVLDEVSFCVQEGQYLAIVGPNGAGKSTLVKTLVHDNRHFTGQFSFDKKLKAIGYVAQQNNDGTYFPATTKEVIESGMARSFLPFLSSESKQILRKIVTELEIDDLLDKSFFTLSGGQKRMVLLARALATSRDFLLLDEPTAGLDAQSTQRMYECIKKLNNLHSTAIVLISHDIEKVTHEADSVLCLEHSTKFFGSAKEFSTTSIYKGLLEHLV